MNERTMLKIHASGDYLFLRTYSRAHKLSSEFYVRRSVFDELEEKDLVVALDAPSVLTIRRDRRAGTLAFDFLWLNRCGNYELCGREETVTVTESRLIAFIRESAKPDGSKQWAALGTTTAHLPRFTFQSRRNLKAVVGNRMIRRRLCKTLASHFRWPGTDEIVVYDDFVPYSFGFTELRDGKQGICGGIILHNHDNDLQKSYYSVHT